MCPGGRIWCKRWQSYPRMDESHFSSPSHNKAPHLTLPRVTVAVPLRNEVTQFPAMIEALLQQTYPSQRLQILLLDGGSEDGTLALAEEVAAVHPHVSVHDNPRRSAAAALNLALRLADGAYIVRIDARSRPAPDYVVLAVQRLQQGLWAGAAGPQVAVGATWAGKVHAAVLNHPLGTGAPRYRHTSKPHESETLFLGAYDRRWLEKVGGWDEGFLANEDFELNARLRAAGGKLLVDPALRITYVARDDLAGLARQYARYGAWRTVTWRRYPHSIRMRHLAPAMLSLSLVLAAAMLIWSPWPLLLLAGSYLLLILAASSILSIRLGPRALPSAMAAFISIHLAWGGAFWLAVLGFSPSALTQV